jgi:hypothetical protein
MTDEPGNVRMLGGLAPAFLLVIFLASCTASGSGARPARGLSEVVDNIRYALNLAPTEAVGGSRKQKD